MNINKYSYNLLTTIWFGQWFKQTDPHNNATWTRETLTPKSCQLSQSRSQISFALNSLTLINNYFNHYPFGTIMPQSSSVVTFRCPRSWALCRRAGRSACWSACSWWRAPRPYSPPAPEGSTTCRAGAYSQRRTYEGSWRPTPRREEGTRGLSNACILRLSLSVMQNRKQSKSLWMKVSTKCRRLF